MRVIPCAVLMTACLVLAGCRTLSSRSPASGTATASGPASDLRPQLPDRTASLTNNSTPGGAVPPDVNGVLAGQVLDPASGRPPQTSIQIMEATASPSAPPREASCDAQGYFTITGLQAGKHYQLTARARNGTMTLLGTAFATPPDARILIQLSDSPAAAGPVAAVVPPATPGADAHAVANGATNPAPGNANWSPEQPPSNALQGTASLGTPRAASDPSPVAPTPPVHPENVATAPGAGSVFPDHRWGIPSNIPSQENRVSPGTPGLGAPPLTPSPSVDRPAPVPSCELVGQTCYNFALNDLDGRPWEYRKHPAKLTLLDFWGTWCGYCVQGIPHMNIFNSYYRSYGLQVVGIAYESDRDSFRDQVEKVDRVRRTKGINYQLLLGGGSHCPVKTQFQVQNFPTVVLLDEQGRIVWRKEGLLRRDELKDLEIIITQRLGFRGR